MKNTAPHPLESIVWNAFAKNEYQDATSLAYFLAGAIVRGGNKAYHTVALDVLGYMQDQGLLERDQHGWSRTARHPRQRYRTMEGFTCDTLDSNATQPQHTVTARTSRLPTLVTAVTF
jgi:hypothetical protein